MSDLEIEAGLGEGADLPLPASCSRRALAMHTSEQFVAACGPHCDRPPPMATDVDIDHLSDHDHLSEALCCFFSW
jgi:hypothetical protein